MPASVGDIDVEALLEMPFKKESRQDGNGAVGTCALVHGRLISSPQSPSRDVLKNDSVSEE